MHISDIDKMLRRHGEVAQAIKSEAPRATIEVERIYCHFFMVI